MEFRQLECFIMVATNGSITKAAEIMHISQPAVTRSIQLLEADIGTPLFDRNGKHISLSAAGKEVLREAKEIIERQGIIYRKAQTFGMQPNQELLLIVTAASEVIPDLVSEFHQRHSELRLRICRQFPQAEDVGVLLSSAVRGCDETTHRTVFSEELMVAVPVGHPLEKKQDISLRELSEYPLLSMTEGHDLRMLQDYYRGKADASFQYLIQCDDPTSLRGFLERGLAPAVVPGKTWPKMPEERVVLRPIRNQSCVRYINVQLLRPERGDDNLRLLFDFVVQYFRAFGS